MMAGSLSTDDDCGAQAGYYGRRAPLVCVHAVGIRRVHPVHDRGDGGVEPLAVRFAGRRIGDHRRLLTSEYSGFKFALFFLGEYLGMFAISGLAITLFLGGWAAPLPFLTWIPSWIWFFAKLLALISVFIWMRGTLPRLRMDQLMNFAWKFMLPMALVQSSPPASGISCRRALCAGWSAPFWSCCLTCCWAAR